MKLFKRLHLFQVLRSLQGVLVDPLVEGFVLDFEQGMFKISHNSYNANCFYNSFDHNCRNIRI